MNINTSEDQKTMIQTLVEYLNNANTMYYYGSPIISDAQYDEYLSILEKAEEETGYILSSSPTQYAGYIIKDKIDVVKHDSPMLSLKKIHSKEEIRNFLYNKDGFISLKLDGLTVRATYENGDLKRLETRGNGYQGNDILFHAKSFVNIPMKIDILGEFVVDGECIICKDDFDKINQLSEEKYENPRNLAAGTLSGLDTKVSSKRYLKFIVWNVVNGGLYGKNTLNLNLAKELGFTIVPYQFVPKDILNKIKDIDYYYSKCLETNKSLAENYQYPIDGAVIKYDGIHYGVENTEKYYGDAVAYKYEDDEVETTLIDIEWTMGTNKLTPVARFTPVYLSGSTIERASVHNISCLKELKLGIGDRITVKKSNMIIPQIAKNLTQSNNYPIPMICPYCGRETEIKKDGIAEELYCTNEQCVGKLLSNCVRFASKQCFNIKGLSEAILQRCIDLGCICSPIDIFDLKRHGNDLMKLNGFGRKSVENLLHSIKESRNVDLHSFINALNIPLIGIGIAKVMSKSCNNDIDNFINRLNNKFDWGQLDGIGNEINNSIQNWYSKNNIYVKRLLSYCKIKKIEPIITKNNIVNTLNGATFCITGKLNTYSNRDTLIADIESHGGKYVSSVTKNTQYLINNDVESQSSKNKKAKKLGCKIITEENYDSLKLPF